MGREKKAVILFSGGLDSAVAAALARREGRELYGLTLDYGQSHRRELGAARASARALGFKRQLVFRLPLKQIAQGSLLGQKAPGAGRGRLAASYVTFRNGVFLSLAISFAEALGATEIWGGWCKADREGFPDCRRDFFGAMARAAKLGTGAGRFQGVRHKILSPLAGLTKARTIRLGKSLGVDFSKTWTCYNGGPKPCGKCQACKARRKGFVEAGFKDPLNF